MWCETPGAWSWLDGCSVGPNLAHTLVSHHSSGLQGQNHEHHRHRKTVEKIQPQITYFNSQSYVLTQWCQSFWLFSLAEWREIGPWAWAWAQIQPCASWIEPWASLDWIPHAWIQSHTAPHSKEVIINAISAPHLPNFQTSKEHHGPDGTALA